MKPVFVRTDKNGTEIWADYTCPRCGGLGGADQWAYTGWTCYECGGTGRKERPTLIKKYTPEYEAKLAERRAKRAAKKLAELRAKADEKNAEFFEKNGFDSKGKTYIILGDTFEIKEELKAQGAKWDNISHHWHIATKPENMETLELSVDDMYDANFAGVYDWRNWKSFPEDRTQHYTYKIEQAENALSAKEAISKHIGAVGEKLTIEVTFKHLATWETKFGTQGLYTFEDAEGNAIVWKTATWLAYKDENGHYKGYEEGDKLTITGTIKEHSEYKGVKQTVLTRAKVQGR